jgi:hypothetical protein
VNDPRQSEVLLRRAENPQGDLPLVADGVLRYVWESRFGPMLIEVRHGQVLVNGKVVEQAGPGASRHGVIDPGTVIE